LNAEGAKVSQRAQKKYKKENTKKVKTKKVKTKKAKGLF
jgi:hypothetical protein